MGRSTGSLRRSILTVIGAAIALMACSPLDAVNSLVPNDGYRRMAEVRYGHDVRQSLDVYAPDAAAGSTAEEGRRAVVIFFYGGNWQSGSKADYRFVAQSLTAAGFIVVIPDYRLFPAVRYPAFIEDGAAAVSWTLDHLAEIGGDPARVHVMGHSAGAYIAMMLALDGRWLGERRAYLRSAVGLAGPYDFLPLTAPDLRAIFAPAWDLALTQPIAFADATAPPLLLLSGATDGTVRPGNTTRLAERLRRAGRPAEVRLYPGVSHGELIAAVASPLEFLAPARRDILCFLGGVAACDRPRGEVGAEPRD